MFMRGRSSGSLCNHQGIAFNPLQPKRKPPVEVSRRHKIYPPMILLAPQAKVFNPLPSPNCAAGENFDPTTPRNFQNVHAKRTTLFTINTAVK